MRFFRFAVWTILIAACQPSLLGQSAEPWRPVTPDELTMSAVKAAAGAPAVRLYYSYFKDDNSRFISEYERIKILSQAGLQRANMEIVLEPGESIKELKARTIHPDGSIVEFTGKPLDKTVIKGHGIKYSAKAFNLPDVSVGSIVEYSYLKVWSAHLVNAVSLWPLQSDLYTVK